jgi:hypothetical protein
VEKVNFGVMKIIFNHLCFACVFGAADDKVSA